MGSRVEEYGRGGVAEVLDPDLRQAGSVEGHPERGRHRAPDLWFAVAFTNTSHHWIALAALATPRRPARRRTPELDSAPEVDVRALMDASWLGPHPAPCEVPA